MEGQSSATAGRDWTLRSSAHAAMLAGAQSNSSVVVCTILATSTAAADDLMSARIAARLRAD